MPEQNERRYRRLDKARSHYRRTVEFVAVAVAGLVGAVLSVHALLAEQARTSPPKPFNDARLKIEVQRHRRRRCGDDPNNGSGTGSVNGRTERATKNASSPRA